MASRLNRWYLWLVAMALSGLGIRLAYAFVSKRHAKPGGDALYYHYAANLLVQGKGFIDPYRYLIKAFHHQVVQTAAHPPLWILVLALGTVLGFKTFFAHIIWSCLVGTVTVLLTGLAAREVAGNRVGLIAAFVAAVYPNFWLNDGLVMSETLVLTVSALIVFLSFRLLNRPRFLTAGALGVACALGALTRAEMGLLVPLLVVPLTLLIRSVSMRRRIGFLVVGVAAAAVTIAPWSAFNLSRMSHFEPISTEFGTTLATANCDATYSGVFLGYWSFGCAARIPETPSNPGAQDTRDRQVALRYVDHHLGRLPVVIGARIGRAFAFFRPIQQIELDHTVETRPKAAAFVGLGMYYVLFALSLVGAVSLFRRRVTIWPFLALTLTVVIAVTITFGQTRYRTEFDMAITVLGAVGTDAILRYVRSRGRSRSRPVTPAPARRLVDEPTLGQPTVLGGQAR